MKDLKWKALVALMIVVAGLFVGFSAETLKAQPETITEYQISPSIAEAQITTNTEGQESPAVYGDVIVWQDNRNGNNDIYMYDLGAETEHQITTIPKARRFQQSMVTSSYGRTVETATQTSTCTTYQMKQKPR